MKRLGGLRLARLAKGKIQAEVALATGIPQAILSLYERGYRRPKDEHLKALLRFYGLSPEGLKSIEAALKNG
jgi:transcriptional regulator with XRE-family HTH domain